MEVHRHHQFVRRYQGYGQPRTLCLRQTRYRRLMRTLANELAPHMIRVNTLHPTGVNTKLINNDHVRGFLETHPEWDANMANALPVDMVEPEDISNAIVWLASEEGRYVTGVSLPVDAGFAGR